MLRFLFCVLILMIGVGESHAKHYRRVEQVKAFTPLFAESWQTTGNIFGSFQQPLQAIRQHAVRSGRVLQMLSHPRGCPARAFCGCGAAVAVFGTPRRDLWLARNWLRFPRVAAANGMAAARSGHVFILRQHVAGDVWVVEDYNSGGHESRLHERSIHGYTIVNPRA